MKNVLIVTRFFPPFSNGGIFRVHAFVKYLPENNWCPVVLTVKEEYSPKNQQDYTLLKDYHPKVKIVRTHSLEPHTGYFLKLRDQVTGVKKTTPWFESFTKPVLRWVFRTIAIPDEHILWLPHAVKAGVKAVKENNIDLIFVSSPPHSAAIIAALISKISKIPLIWDVRDDWVGNPYYTDNNPWLYRFLSHFQEKKLVQTAQTVVTVTSESIESFEKKYPRQPKTKFQLIRNGYDAKETLAAQTGLPSRTCKKLRIIYTGILPAKRNPSAFFQALLDINHERPLRDIIQVDFYGSIRQDFVDLANLMGLQGIVNFMGQVPRIESIRQIVNADIGLIIIPEEEGSQTAIPGKLYEYVGAQKIVMALCPQDSACARLIQAKKLGISISNNDVTAIKKTLYSFLDDHARGKLTTLYQPENLVEFERANQTQILSVILESATRK